MLTTTQHITNTKKRLLLPLFLLLGRLSCAAEVAEIMLLPLEDGGGVTDDDDDGSILFFAIVVTTLKYGPPCASTYQRT